MSLGQGTFWQVEVEAPDVTHAAMAEAFFSLYCLVKNSPPQKVFFKFFKDLDMFFIYPKTAPIALWKCAYILQVSEFHCTLMVPRKKLLDNIGLAQSS